MKWLALAGRRTGMGGLVSLLRRGEVRVPHLDPGVYSRSSRGAVNMQQGMRFPPARLSRMMRKSSPDAA